jgi:biopolymer transport protein ExbB
MSGDDKLPLKFQKEAFDPANEIALFWVKVPRIMAGAKQDFIWIYYGNKNATDGQDRGGVYDVNQVAVYHLDEDQGKPKDETAYGNQPSEFSSGMGTPAVIGAGISLNGSSDRIVIPRSSSLNFSTGFTFSAWIRMFGPQQNTRILSWEDQNQSLVIEVDQTKIFAKAVSGGQAFETPKTTDLPLESWHLLAVTAEPSKRLAIYIDGAETASVNLPGPLPEPAADICIGASLKGTGFFSGDLDEVELSKTARSAEWLRAAFKGQGPDNVLASVMEEESVAATGESLTIHLMKVVARTITLDGWLVIGILAILGAFCWVIFLTKSLSLRQINRENNAFSQELKEAPAFDTLYNGENNKFSGSSLYRIYNAGFEELELTQPKTGNEKNGISKSALKSVESALDKATMRESRQLGTGLMVLTFGISGGPFLGLFGTVWGVMNTFAGMAEAGEANLTAIAPGVASALACTLCGLLVAIPALFSYSYVTQRIKDLNADMYQFASEFVVKIEGEQ